MDGFLAPTPLLEKFAAFCLSRETVGVSRNTWYDGEPAYRRGSVLRFGVVAIHLSGPPGDCSEERTGRPCPTLGLAPGGVCRAARVAPDAGALLPHRFTLACTGGARHRRSVLCGTFLRVTPTGR